MEKRVVSRVKRIKEKLKNWPKKSLIEIKSCRNRRRITK